MTSAITNFIVRIFNSVAFSVALAASAAVVGDAQANAQCTQLASGLRSPLGTALTNQGNLLVSETGTTAPRSGRISIIDPNGNRRTLLRGLPSGINDVGDPSGPAGIFIRGRTLYLAIGAGDVGIAGPFPGTALENPNGPRHRSSVPFWPFTSVPRPRRLQMGLPLPLLTSRLSPMAKP